MELRTLTHHYRQMISHPTVEIFHGRMGPVPYALLRNSASGLAQKPSRFLSRGSVAARKRGHPVPVLKMQDPSLHAY